MMKRIIIVILFLCFASIVHSKSIVITVPSVLEDYTIPNEVNKELKNSKYHNYFKGNEYHDSTDFSLYDNSVNIFVRKPYDNKLYHGVVMLYKITYVEGRYELIYRNEFHLLYIIDKKEELIREIKNTIIEWIDDGRTDY